MFSILSRLGNHSRIFPICSRNELQRGRPGLIGAPTCDEYRCHPGEFDGLIWPIPDHRTHLACDKAVTLSEQAL